MPIDLTALSRATSHALRHEPWLYELELDEFGWTPLDALMAALQRERNEWSSLTADDMQRMIAVSSKQRHEIQEGKIRAFYGHSVPDKLKKIPAVPPDMLFHGTDPTVLPQIQATGLLPMSRQYVHLSNDEDMAWEVGRRKTRTPVILRVLSKKAAARNIPFYEGNDKVWLADFVPPEFIRGPEDFSV